MGFALGIAFMFKERLLPSVTEGTLFGYSLVAGYIFLSNPSFLGVGGIGFNMWLFSLVALKASIKL